MRLEFHGAAGGVTGSHMVLDDEGFRLGIDAGLFQGGDTDLNRQGFGHSPRSLRAMLLTHAHVDHSGRIPLLLKDGFHGPVYTTPATADLCEIMLMDSAHLMEEETLHASRHPDQVNGRAVTPLYTKEDATAAAKRFQPIHYGQKLKTNAFSAVFRDAGHILGSSIIELSTGDRKIVFSGDLGRPGAPFLRDPEMIEGADYLVLESTYGDTAHGERAGRGKKLLDIILDTVNLGGNIIIPAFAVGRTQEVLYELNPYAEAGRLKGIKCFVDSPMAISTGEIYRRHPECFNDETRQMLRDNDDPLIFPGIVYARSKQKSMAINDVKEPHIIISASGMATGGRVIHHLKTNLECPECTVLFIGYQAEGTLGRRLQSGRKTVRILGKEIDVKANIQTLSGFSAHADRGEITQWLKGFRDLPRKIFLSHGEPGAAAALAGEIREIFGADVVVAKAGERYDLG